MITSRSDSPKGWIDPGSTTGWISCSLPAAYLPASSPSPALSFHLSSGTPPTALPPPPLPGNSFQALGHAFLAVMAFLFLFMSFLFLIFLFCIGVQPISNVVIVSVNSKGTQPYMYTCPFSPPDSPPIQAATFTLSRFPSAI